MTSPPSNPRRSYKAGASPTSATIHTSNILRASDTSPTADIDRSLRKSSTFHSSSSPATSEDPILQISLLSRRSPTSPKALEDAVAADDRRNRISHLLGVVDRSLSGLEAFTTDCEDLAISSDLPVPRFMVDAHAPVDDPSRMDIDDTSDSATPSKLSHQHNRHQSDSGIGSSITGSDEPSSRRDAADHLADYKNSIPSVISDIQSGINGISSAVDRAVPHGLSAYACRQIQKHIIVPILKEDTLKEFHPLITGIPLRVRRKEIGCLRDLEKVLLWLAPRFSASPSSFVNFCETSIQCLHTTVGHLNETDLQRPSDRPYTNGYFLDLTEQVRQYAAMISAARERAAAAGVQKEKIGLNETISLRGGLGKTDGRAELVRSTKDGHTISLRTGEILTPDAGPSDVRRSRTGEAEDDYFLSMARRRKAAAAKEAQRCSECDKEFKRPCDLTKHEKTHSRPWKCNEPGCKYSHYGWPTEKERDRHVNDKHTMTPSMYKCHFNPCPYESKRQSNCKQHMEKAHGWAYVRSKNNGKSGKQSSKVSHKPTMTPQTTPGSQIFDASGSEFGDTSSSYARGSSGASIAFDSMGRASTSPFQGLNNTFASSPSCEPDLTWAQPDPRLTPQSPYAPGSDRLLLDSQYPSGDARAMLPSLHPTHLQADPTLFDETFVWGPTDLNTQLMTPVGSAESRPLDASYGRHPSMSMEEGHTGLVAENPNLSPGAVGGVMLYSPHEDYVADEGYDDFMIGKPKGDFSLYDSIPVSGMETANLFSDLPPFNSSTWTTDFSDLMDE